MHTGTRAIVRRLPAARHCVVQHASHWGQGHLRQLNKSFAHKVCSIVRVMAHTVSRLILATECERQKIALENNYKFFRFGWH